MPLNIEAIMDMKDKNSGVPSHQFIENGENQNIIRLPETFKYLLQQLIMIGDRLDIALGEAQLRTVSTQRNYISISKLTELIPELYDELKDSLMQMINILSELQERGPDKLS
jgi:hypothetical protein